MKHNHPGTKTLTSIVALGIALLLPSITCTAVAQQLEPAFTETALYSTTMPQNNDETDIYYPVPDANDSASYTFPVALFLQGGKVNKSYFSEFANKLAAYGFIVVVPNHYADFTLTDPDYPGIEIDFMGFFPENQQIPDVLTFMSAENANAASPLYGIVNSEILALTGHSFGSAVIIDAIQETCEFPLCRPEGTTFTLPEEVKAVALTGINTIPFGNPFDTVNRSTDNPVPMAIINGDQDENAEYHDTKDSYNLIENLPKSLVFVKGANHYGLCDENNPGNPNYPAVPQIDGTPTPQENPPTLDQDISIETTARWVALFLRAHALNDPAALEYISTTGRLLDPNVEVRYGNEQLDYEVLLGQASEIDDTICGYTQTLFGDIDETSGITVDAVNMGSAFSSTKATVDGNTKTAIPVYRIVQGTSDEIFRNDKINTMIWCKTRTPEAIEWNTGIDYTDQETAAGTCKQVNEYVYNMTRDLLTDEQRARYINEGKPIVFTDETIVGQGIDFYALDQYSLITDMGTYLSISPASLESDFIDFEDDRHGAKYCKIISSQNLLAWMQDGAFNNGSSLTPADSLTDITCDDMENSTGSCYFINEHTSTYMCEDYIGPNYTGGDSGTAKAKCDNRSAGVYVDGVACADRTDTTGLLTGICAINETADGAYTWSLYYPEGEVECPLRFFTCNECSNDNDCSDGLFCNGDEICISGECIPGADPCEAGESCDEDAKICVEPIPDELPAFGDGPFVAAGSWPIMTADSDNPIYLTQDQFVLWTFSDDYASCPGFCTHTAEYQTLGDSTWTELSVDTDPTEQWYAYTELPIERLQNATMYALRFAVTDCAGQSTESGEYYFKTAVGIDTPPVITAGPFVAAGAWPVLPKSYQSDQAPVLDQNTTLLWSFTDDYLGCGGVCSHRALYCKEEAGQCTSWTDIAVSTDPTGKDYAYTELPIGSLDDGTYWFWFEAEDCAGQKTESKVHSFKVAQPQ